jgi:hypothetical protein
VKRPFASPRTTAVPEAMTCFLNCNGLLRVRSPEERPQELDRLMLLLLALGG